MEKQDIQQAIIKAKHLEQAQQGAVIIAFALTGIFAYYSPDWLWFQGPDVGWKNVILFLAIGGAITYLLWWAFEKQAAKESQDVPSR